MGQTLTEPSTEKETSSFENDLFLVGVSSMQGWRTGILSCLMPSLHQHPYVSRSVCLSITPCYALTLRPVVKSSYLN